MLRDITDEGMRSLGSPSAAVLPTSGSELLLAVGVLTHPDNGERRRAVRETWGGAHETVGRRVLLRFVVGNSSATIHLAEQRVQRDIVTLAVRENWSVLDKTVGWLKAALEWSPRWVAATDDDAFLRLSMVVPDLALLSAHGFERVAYGPVEWYTFDRESGILGVWGSNPGQAGRGWLQEQRRGNLRLTRPFPFLKGPLMVYDAALARWLSRSERDSARLFPGSLPSHRNGKGRALHDVALGFIMATAPPPGGVTLVDVAVRPTLKATGEVQGWGGGFLEVRPAASLPSPAVACPHLACFSCSQVRPAASLASPAVACLRGAHLGSRSLAARRRRCAPHSPGCTAPSLLRSCMHVLHAHRGAGPSVNTTVQCNQAQPSWGNKSRGAVVGFDAWRKCGFRQLGMCERGTYTPPRDAGSGDVFHC